MTAKGAPAASASSAAQYPASSGPALVKTRLSPRGRGAYLQRAARVPQYEAAGAAYLRADGPGDERRLAAGLGPGQKQPLFHVALRSARCSIICPAMDMAISAGVSALISSPMGVTMRSSCPSVKPCSLSAARTPAALCRLPMTPM